jgi:hypothetical protein
MVCTGLDASLHQLQRVSRRARPLILVLHMTCTAGEERAYTKRLHQRAYTSHYTSDTSHYTSDTSHYTSDTSHYTSDTSHYTSDTSHYTSHYTSDTPAQERQQPQEGGGERRKEAGDDGSRGAGQRYREGWGSEGRGLSRSRPHPPARPLVLARSDGAGWRERGRTCEPAFSRHHAAHAILKSQRIVSLYSVSVAATMTSRMCCLQCSTLHGGVILHE